MSQTTPGQRRDIWQERALRAEREWQRYEELWRKSLAEAARQTDRALAAERERDALRAGLEKALHELTFTHNLTVTDKPGEYGDALAEGLDADAAHDCQMEVSWVTDHAAIITELTTLLGPPATAPERQEQGTTPDKG